MDFKTKFFIFSKMFEFVKFLKENVYLFTSSLQNDENIFWRLFVERNHYQNKVYDLKWIQVDYCIIFFHKLTVV